MNSKSVSIIVPLHIIGQRFLNDLLHFFNLDYLNYELIIVSDKLIHIKNKKVKIICTEKNFTSPAEKRDIAIKNCNGEICAFIDDDAYPDKNWLKNAIKHFDNNSIAGVCGPGMTPEDDGFIQKAGGAIYSSFLGSGINLCRFVPRKMRFVKDFPAYNLLIRRSILLEIGGFDSTFYGGEDTKLCLQIIKSGMKIVYDPTVIVYHHRRPLFTEHLKQISNVGRHRGYFYKNYPETSRKAFYILPTFFIISVIVLIVLSIFFQIVRIFLVSIVVVYLLLSFISTFLASKDIKIAIVASAGMVLTHVTYGAAFLKGLFVKNLKR